MDNFVHSYLQLFKASIEILTTGGRKLFDCFVVDCKRLDMIKKLCYFCFLSLVSTKLRKARDGLM